jgi:hypothetical protein
MHRGFVGWVVWEFDGQKTSETHGGNRKTTRAMSKENRRLTRIKYQSTGIQMEGFRVHNELGGEYTHIS